MNCRAFSQSTISKLHDLSFPKGNYINSHVPPENSAVQFDSIYTVIKLIKHVGRHCLMGKCDIEDAFRLVIYSFYRFLCQVLPGISYTTTTDAYPWVLVLHVKYSNHFLVLYNGLWKINTALLVCLELYMTFCLLDLQIMINVQLTCGVFPLYVNVEGYRLIL